MLLSGDVHYAYLAEAHFPGHPARTRLYQAVCSPFRNGLCPAMERANRLSFSRFMARSSSLLARLARVPEPPLDWEMKHGPFFENEVATLDLHGSQALIRLERTPARQMRLECVDETRLT